MNTEETKLNTQGNNIKPIVIGSFPDGKRIVTEAILAAKKVDSVVGVFPSNRDIRMFCLGAKWMQDWVSQ